MRIISFLACAILFMGCKSYTYFKFDHGSSEIYTSHKKGPQPYCQKLYVCTNAKRNWYDTVYCIISPCCTGIYFDTTGIAAQEIKYAKGQTHSETR